MTNEVNEPQAPSGKKGKSEDVRPFQRYLPAGKLWSSLKMTRASALWPVKLSS
jgi:hypothetical protein